MNRVRAFDHISRTIFLLEMQCIGQDDIFDNQAQITTRRDPAAVHLIWSKNTVTSWGNMVWAACRYIWHLHQPWKKTKRGNCFNARFCLEGSLSKGSFAECLHSYIPLEDASFSMTIHNTGSVKKHAKFWSSWWQAAIIRNKQHDQLLSVSAIHSKRSYDQSDGSPLPPSRLLRPTCSLLSSPQQPTGPL